jgi:hypothetical protein
MSTMTEDELDFLYEQALHNESAVSVDWADCNIEEDEESYDFDISSPFDEYDAHHAVHGDTWTDEDEASLEEWEEQRRAKIAERNEY